MSQSESFLRRWSRRKLQTLPESPPNPPATPALPQADTLAFDSDFSAFLNPEVDSKTRLQALKKLFMNDHYRAMDGLDVYVEDYSRPAALPADMLSRLDHAQKLLRTEEDSTADRESPPSLPSAQADLATPEHKEPQA